MGINSHYFVLSSDDSHFTHPTNNPHDFTVELPGPVTLDGSWECAMIDVHLVGASSAPVPVHLCIDICEDSYANDSCIPLLRTVLSKGESNSTYIQFFHPLYMHIKRDQIRRMRMFIKVPHNNRSSFVCEHLTCTLHLCRAA